MNFDDANEFAGSELDRQVREALAMEADSSGVQRLEGYWQAQSWKDRWQRRAYFAVSAAAAAVVFVGLLIVANRGDEVGAKRANGDSAPVARPGGNVTVEKIADEKGERDVEPRLAGREPTEYERFVFVARRNRPAPMTAASRIDEAISRRGGNHGEIVSEVEAAAGVEGLMYTARRAAEPTLRRAAMARLLEIGSDEALVGFLALVRDGRTRQNALAVADAAASLPLAPLIALLDHSDKNVRRSAALLLGQVNGPEVTQALIVRVMEAPDGATEAWMALLACRGEKAEAFVAYAARQPQMLGRLNNARVQLSYMIP